VARDQATPNSDVVLLVDLPDGASLFDHAELKPDRKARVDHTNG
jgi:predicted nucleotidyltransferase